MSESTGPIPIEQPETRQRRYVGRELVGPVMDALGDPVSRTILEETRAQPVSVRTIAEAADVSPSTVYRRVDALESAGLVRETSRLSGNGTPTLYTTDIQSVTLEFDEGGPRLSMSFGESARPTVGDEAEEFDVTTELSGQTVDVTVTVPTDRLRSAMDDPEDR